ncbi:metallophosphoesterase [Methylobacterium brachythecii]|uniref:Metallophosphoesterase n=1 Tax=Methylobacterium brachythecii TaxID=1176177 RepID=A0A7W6AT24_9HYPH|nr:metallophosphoesterase [Methylobacterium brachythecii]MBB3905462.1 hypothetical protein [Methylobacterium brachythecii]GLS44943.1 metallophosphoesterase [Methylobacterium brachythecii]
MLILPSRRQVLTGLGASTLAAGATGTYAFAVEPRFRLDVTRYAPKLAGWTPGLILRIAAIADVHVCEPWMPLDRVAEIVDATNALKPDLILLLGDYPAGRRVTWKPVALSEFARVAEGLSAPLGVHAILGNHDWWEDEAALDARKGPVEARRVLEARGIPVMENDAVRLVKDGRPFWLAGLADQQPFWIRRDRRSLADIPGTLAKLTDDAPAILMAHEPEIFPKIPDRFALTLAGHTHGGQVRIFGHSPFVAGYHDPRYVYGHIVEGRRQLIVSGGLGVSNVAVRFGVPPEIVLVELGTTDQA